ncbi:xylulokinase [Shewanella surugensis]|uniref:Xylulose kinase n=1 Tax=Shewanella surugensis TaxID=212020 RepID=A0ABT0L8A4_9GAMM|nr:xylulokinase [Shewanella surugensis]MCL1123922.1 xylulokinase [Shewanella surugensis]
MYLGIDLGTSAIKVVLLADDNQPIAIEEQVLSISRPQLLWSEQSPDAWWNALLATLDRLSLKQALVDVKGIGLTGQMHGATLLDNKAQLLRPAILWNDGRSAFECQEIEAQLPQARMLCSNQMMPGFTAPKLLWVKKHEPEIFDKVHKVLLPKDYLRFKLSGEFSSDLSDASGTGWLNVKQRQWSEELLNVTGMTIEQMPKLYEGNEISGYLQHHLAKRWKMHCVPIVAGAGDNAAGALGVGICKPRQSMLSLGTSGVYFVVSDGAKQNPDAGVHSFCHALPNQWHLMSVILSAASCLDWFAHMIGPLSVSQLLQEVETSTLSSPASLLFLPYLSGERTPHNNPNAKGVFLGLSHSTTRADMTKAVLEGVSYALADGFRALHEVQPDVEFISLIGGGSKSVYWRQLLANVLGKQVEYREGGEIGPALGAARLAKYALMPNNKVSDIFPLPKLIACYEPELSLYREHLENRAKFSELYRSLIHLF